MSDTLTYLTCPGTVPPWSFGICALSWVWSPSHRIV